MDHRPTDIPQLAPDRKAPILASSRPLPIYSWSFTLGLKQFGPTPQAATVPRVFTARLRNPCELPTPCNNRLCTAYSTTSDRYAITGVYIATSRFSPDSGTPGLLSTIARHLRQSTGIADTSILKPSEELCPHRKSSTTCPRLHVAVGPGANANPSCWKSLRTPLCLSSIQLLLLCRQFRICSVS